MLGLASHLPSRASLNASLASLSLTLNPPCPRCPHRHSDPWHVPASLLRSLPIHSVQQLEAQHAFFHSPRGRSFRDLIGSVSFDLVLGPGEEEERRVLGGVLELLLAVEENVRSLEFKLRRSEGGVVVLPTTFLLALRNCRKLERLALLGSDVEFEDEDILQFARLWPNLKHLNVPALTHTTPVPCVCDPEWLHYPCTYRFHLSTPLPQTLASLSLRLDTTDQLSLLLKLAHASQGTLEHLDLNFSAEISAEELGKGLEKVELLKVTKLTLSGAPLEWCGPQANFSPSWTEQALVLLGRLPQLTHLTFDYAALGNAKFMLALEAHSTLHSLALDVADPFAMAQLLSDKIEDKYSPSLLQDFLFFFGPTSRIQNLLLKDGLMKLWSLNDQRPQEVRQEVKWCIEAAKARGIALKAGTEEGRALRMRKREEVRVKHLAYSPQIYSREPTLKRFLRATEPPKERKPVDTVPRARPLAPAPAPASATTSATKPIDMSDKKWGKQPEQPRPLEYTENKEVKWNGFTSTSTGVTSPGAETFFSADGPSGGEGSKSSTPATTPASSPVVPIVEICEDEEEGEEEEEKGE